MVSKYLQCIALCDHNLPTLQRKGREDGRTDVVLVAYKREGEAYVVLKTWDRATDLVISEKTVTTAIKKQNVSGQASLEKVFKAIVRLSLLGRRTYLSVDFDTTLPAR